MSDVAEVGEIVSVPKPGANTPWPDEQVAFLRECIAGRVSSGLTVEKLAARFGVYYSRNAVLGKAARLGLQFNSGPADSRRRGRRSGGARKPCQPRERSTDKRSKVALPPEPLPPIALDDLAIPPEQRRQLMDLDEHCCRWPVGDPRDEGFFYCGAPEADIYAGRPYCRSHTWRATNHAGMARYRGMEA